MNILWFSNTPCLAVEKLSPDQVFGGWLYSLNEALVQHDNINLSICFYTTIKTNPFTYKNTRFFPIYRDSELSIYNKIISRLRIKPNDNRDLTKLLDVVHIVNPDIIHIHGIEENYGLIQKDSNIPVIISIQGFLSPIYEKFYAGIPKRIVSFKESIKHKLYLTSTNREYFKLRYKAKREQQILTHAKHIIGRTDWDRRISRILAPNSKYYVINEILRSSFYTVKWESPLSTNHLRIVSTTSDKIYKGFETIVKTAAILTKNNRTKFTWYVIGLNEDSNIVKLIKRWFKADFNTLNIVFLGILRSEEIIDILSKSDIYCQASRIENSPNSLAEAMLLGMPIVATNVGGTSTLLENKKEGILVQEGDSYEFAGAIQELFYDQELALKLAKNARQKAKITHNKQTIVNDLIKIYSSLSEK